MSRNGIVAAVAAFMLGAAMGAFAWFAPSFERSGPMSVPHPVWREIDWPFALDQWGKGKAFRCDAADCGTEVNVYIRAKIGFCNCQTGVADDEELTRIGDLSLMGQNPEVLGPGHPIKVAWMKGRSRTYGVPRLFQVPQSALSVAFNDHCDAIVATITVANDNPAAVEPSVLTFLNSQTIIHWAEVTLGL